MLILQLVFIFVMKKIASRVGNLLAATYAEMQLPFSWIEYSDSR